MTEEVESCSACICRMIFLVRVLTPSVRPLWWGRMRPAFTAARSSSRPLQKLCRWGRPAVRTVVIHWVSLSSLTWAMRA